MGKFAENLNLGKRVRPSAVLEKKKMIAPSVWKMVWKCFVYFEEGDMMVLLIDRGGR